MIPHDQRIFADPKRGDGHDANGVPGDCWKACIASLMDVEDYESVPHFVALDDWFVETYRYVWDVHGLSLRKWRNAANIPDGPEFFIGVGPSPRGDFHHAVIIDRAGNLIHDPHPSKLGILEVEEFFAPITEQVVASLGGDV